MSSLLKPLKVVHGLLVVSHVLCRESPALFPLRKMGLYPEGDTESKRRSLGGKVQKVPHKTVEDKGPASSTGQYRTRKICQGVRSCRQTSVLEVCLCVHVCMSSAGRRGEGGCLGRAEPRRGKDHRAAARSLVRAGAVAWASAGLLYCVTLASQFRSLNCKMKVILPTAEVAPGASTEGAWPI